jgi:predicted phosphodiesterase
MPLTLNAVNRRQFLGSVVSAGLIASLLPKSVFAESAAGNSDHWVFLSDTHIPGDPKIENHGYNPNKNFETVRNEVLKLADKPKGIIVTGDFAHLQGKPEDYLQLVKQVAPYLDCGIPVHVSFGNHDNLDNYYAAFTQYKKESLPLADEHITVIETPSANLFILDSLYKTNVVSGFFGSDQLTWLKKELNARKNKPAVLFAHHNLDNRNGSLMDREEFWAVIKPLKHVKAYIYGHTHVYTQEVKDNIHLINLPALGWEFQKGVQPLGWSDVLFSSDGIQLTLNAVDKEHPKNGDVRKFTWLR